MPRGGKRPGAPKGNLNALGGRGRTSQHVQRLIDALVQVPETRDALLAFRRSQLREERRARKLAASLLTFLLDDQPLPRRDLDRLADDPALFISTFTHLVAEMKNFREINRTLNLETPHNQTWPDPPGSR